MNEEYLYTLGQKVWVVTFNPTTAKAGTVLEVSIQLDADVRTVTYILANDGITFSAVESDIFPTVSDGLGLIQPPTSTPTITPSPVPDELLSIFYSWNDEGVSNITQRQEISTSGPVNATISNLDNTTQSGYLRNMLQYANDKMLAYDGLMSYRIVDLINNTTVSTGATPNFNGGSTTSGFADGPKYAYDNTLNKIIYYSRTEPSGIYAHDIVTQDTVRIAPSVETLGFDIPIWDINTIQPKSTPGVVYLIFNGINSNGFHSGTVIKADLILGELSVITNGLLSTASNFALHATLGHDDRIYFCGDVGGSGRELLVLNPVNDTIMFTGVAIGTDSTLITIPNTSYAFELTATGIVKRLNLATGTINSMSIPLSDITNSGNRPKRMEYDSETNKVVFYNNPGAAPASISAIDVATFTYEQNYLNFAPTGKSNVGSVLVARSIGVTPVTPTSTPPVTGTPAATPTGTPSVTPTSTPPVTATPVGTPPATPANTPPVTPTPSGI